MNMKRIRAKHGFIISWLGSMGLFLVLVLTNGCMVVGPDYRQPDKYERMETWANPGQAGMSTNTPDLQEWWRRLGDPVLDDLIDEALGANLDLEQARSRVREARAQRGIQSAARFPTLDASGSAAKIKKGEASSDELYSSGFDASWELDLFGSVTRRIEAASADVQAMTEARRNVRISLVAELALNYVEYRSFQKRLKLARANVEAQRQTLELVRAKYSAQTAGRLEVEQAKTNLESTRSSIPPLQTGRERSAHRLAVLAGKRPGQIGGLLQKEQPVPAAPANIATGIPADLLRRRPDIRRAERELAAQSARIGIAMADLYPRFTLNGTLQFESSESSDLFDTGNRFGSIGPTFKWSIFNAGSIRNNIEIQTEKQRQALLEYEQTILRALEETENAMTAYARENERRQSLRKAATAARNATGQAELLYQEGIEDFLQVLDAQRVLFDAEDRLATSNAEVVSNLIRLYKALGGGWHSKPD